MPTLMPLLASVNDVESLPDTTLIVVTAALIALLALVAAGNFVRKTLAVAFQLIETALAVCLVSVLVVLVAFAAGYLIAVT
jgi:hypothetical protein